MTFCYSQLGPNARTLKKEESPRGRNNKQLMHVPQQAQRAWRFPFEDICQVTPYNGTQFCGTKRRSLPPPDAQKVKIRIYFASWWALNVVFNIYNKKVLNTRVPLPMAYLAIVFFYHAGFVAATVSMSKVVVSFTHIIKSAELGNKISVAFSWFLYVLFKIRVYLILAITAKNIIYLLPALTACF